MEIIECERLGCSGIMMYDFDIEQIICNKCGSIGECVNCDGYIFFDEVLGEFICNKCNAIYR